MKPSVGVLVEVIVFGAFLSLGAVAPSGLPFALYAIVAQLLATYLLHCPAHYAVGMLGGIRFREMRVGRTALARALPPRLAGPARLVPILTLATERESLSKAPRRWRAAMYASGTLASVASAFVIAAAASTVEQPTYSAIFWVVALGYFAFDLVFSPRSGDLMRARGALRPSRVSAPTS